MKPVSAYRALVETSVELALLRIGEHALVCSRQSWNYEFAADVSGWQRSVNRILHRSKCGGRMAVDTFAKTESVVTRSEFGEDKV